MTSRFKKRPRCNTGFENTTSIFPLISLIFADLKIQISVNLSNLRGKLVRSRQPEGHKNFKTVPLFQ